MTRPVGNAGTDSGIVAAPVRVAMVTNIPAPYRLPIYDLLAKEPWMQFRVFFCSGREPDREWKLAQSGFDSVFLKGKFFNYRGRYIHTNPDAWDQLSAYAPDVVISTGFNPTHLGAFFYAWMNRKKHICMTDGTRRFETVLSRVHRWVRAFVYARSHAYVGASDGAFDLYETYEVPPSRVYKSHLCGNNAGFGAVVGQEKRFDFVFCGRFLETKNPIFVLHVAEGVAKRLGRRVSVAFLGSGGIERETEAAAEKMRDWVDSAFMGFVGQDELPEKFGACRVLLFPSTWEAWGVVVNEACAAGLPVVTTHEVGAARELVRDGENGFVLPLDLPQWIEAAVKLLEQPALYTRMALRGRELVQSYSYENAALGVAEAVRAATGLPQTTASAEGSPVGRALPKRRRVVIVQRRMTHYRLPLFNQMRALLEARGIELDVVFGDTTDEERARGDDGHLPWGTYVPCKYLLGGRLCWQDPSAIIHGADLVVVTQENKLAFNLGLLFGRRKVPVAYWGHGRNFQSRSAESLGERFKRVLTRRADWWFAYSALSAKVVSEAGFSADRMTVLNNAIDTTALRRDLAAVTPDEQARMRAELGLGDGRVGLMIASLYKTRRVDFLLDAARKIRAACPDFQLVIVGDGPERVAIERAQEADGAWIHWAGVRKGKEKAILLSLATVMLNPGVVGLGVQDAFLSGAPLVTTDFGLYSPEFAYLEFGVNSVLAGNSEAAYADAVIALFNDPAQLARLKAGCLVSANTYSIERMAERFCDGIEQALDHCAGMRSGRDRDSTEQKVMQ